MTSALEDTMITAWHQVRVVWVRHDRPVDVRTAALIRAIDEVAVSSQDLGILP